MWSINHEPTLVQTTDLTPSRRQPINWTNVGLVYWCAQMSWKGHCVRSLIWTNGDLIYWRIYMSLSLNVLTAVFWESKTRLSAILLPAISLYFIYSTQCFIWPVLSSRWLSETYWLPGKWVLIVTVSAHSAADSNITESSCLWHHTSRKHHHWMGSGVMF